ncbi:hypothetical protein [Streptomyces sp. NPDC092903]|uniref:hypothetical protein n=1 Tax=Streptomyces sp. NPDC092903 TaxID=3366017 RepID=UPI003813510E
MSMMRRRLGTGPATPVAPREGVEQPRLLAAERIGPGARLAAREDEVPELRGRRRLGPGAADV